jgi:hypothetical protein
VRGRTAAVVATYVAVWLVTSLACAAAIFLSSSRATTLASHDAVLRPDLSGYLVLQTGPVLPDVRVSSGSRIGVDVTLGKTDARTTQELVDRYALIASQPEGPRARVEEAVLDLAATAAARGAVLGLVPLLVWALVGSARRRQLAGRVRGWRGIGAAALVGMIVVGLLQPWEPSEETLGADQDWVPLGEFLGAGVPIPEELDGVEVRGDVTTNGTRRLVESAVDTYQNGKTFYRDAATAAADLALRVPTKGDTVVALVSDRHDNIGMDAVARAIADAAGASAVFDAGDDTSTGQTWEAFSLDSVSAAFDDGPYDDSRWAVAGNHDHGSFVRRYLADHGWTMLDGEAVDGPAGVRLLGVDDPRSSGLGSWRDETGLSFEEVGERLADAACAADEDGDRISTVLVHDANLGDPTLQRGCADLVLGGHLHVRQGPTRVVGESGAVGYSYTTGTTGGAAFAFALGSKIRRPAEVSLVTYRQGRPAGIQSVVLQTDGSFEVVPYVTLTLADPSGRE